ncbi:MAG: hypothetical protein HQL50_15475 [Magnetococcales bacterium]|nr:hypothetical protein [Magnetococcales bacterium]
MPATITVKKISDGPYTFEVTVSETNGSTRHAVTMSDATWKSLAKGQGTLEQCIEASFRFLLDNEPKEAILSRFDVMVITRYFPNFASELPGYLSRL